jgi:nucleoside-diphosphate-sugar epimerase
MAQETIMSRLFCFGLGYTARRLGSVLLADGWRVAGTSRADDDCADLSAAGFEVYRFDAEHPLGPSALDGATHILTSVPPDDSGDPVLRHHGTSLEALSGLQWVGYLSATSVYGDTDGAWVDETAACVPTTDRGRGRLAAEAEWLARHRDSGLPVHVFRLAGIYGPGRSALDQIRSGRARRIDRPDHLFSRIHVDDIVGVLQASMARPDPGTIYNVCDDTPAASADVVAFAAELLGVDPPPLIAFDDAGLSPMARSFYADNRLVSNERIKARLGVDLKYTDFRTGLQHVLEQEAPG